MRLLGRLMGRASTTEISHRSAFREVVGGAKNPSSRANKASSTKQRRHALICRAVPSTAPNVHRELTVSDIGSSGGQMIIVQKSAIASQVVAPRPTNTELSGQPVLAGNSNCSSEALQRAMTSLKATKDLYSYVAEYDQLEVVQQQVQAVLDSQELLVASLRQLQQQGGAAVASADNTMQAALDKEEFESTVDDVRMSTALDRTSTDNIVAAAASNMFYPMYREPEGDVFETSHAAQCVASINSPVTSIDDPVQQQLTAVWAGVAASRGQRRYMEDCSAIHSLHPELGVQHHSVHSPDSTLFAGVYDGHGGRSTAAYAAAQLPTVLHQELGNSSRRSAAVKRQEVFSSVFHRVDSSWAAHGHVEKSGSTAVTAMINKKNLVVANVGDSVAVLARGGCSKRLTHAHKLCCPDELARVTAAGGQVLADRAGNPRLMQSQARWHRYVAPLTLAVTRGFGDFGFKGLGGDLVIPTPFVSEHELSPADQLLLLTSDGVTDVMGDDSMMEVAINAVTEARNVTNSGSELAAAAAAAVKDTAAAAGAWDNLTVVAMLLDWKE